MISIQKLTLRTWNPAQVVDGVYILSSANPLNFADYAYALHAQRGLVAELYRLIGKENVRKLVNGTVTRPRVPPLIIITGKTWEITPAGIERYRRSWDAQGLSAKPNYAHYPSQRYPTHKRKPVGEGVEEGGRKIGGRKGLLTTFAGLEAFLELVLKIIVFVIGAAVFLALLALGVVVIIGITVTPILWIPLGILAVIGFIFRPR